MTAPELVGFILYIGLVCWAAYGTAQRYLVRREFKSEANDTLLRQHRAALDEIQARTSWRPEPEMPWPLTEGWLQQQVAGEIKPNSTDDFIKDLDRLINNIMWNRLAEQEGPRGIVSITNGEPRRPPVPEVLS